MKTITKHDINFTDKKIKSINGITFKDKKFILTKPIYTSNKSNTFNNIEIHQSKLSNKFKR